MDYLHRNSQPVLPPPQYHRPKQSKLRYMSAGMRRWLNRRPSSLRQRLQLGVKVLVVLILLNGVLFILQLGRMPAMAKLNGTGYGFKGVGSAKRLLTENLAKQDLVVEASSTKTFKATEAGITFDGDKTFNMLTHKSGWERIPLVSFFSDMFIDIKPVYSVDQKVLEAKLDPLITDINVPVKHAEAIIPADLTKPVTITQESDGRELNAGIAAEEVMNEVNKQDFNVTITEKIIKPLRTKKDVEAFMPSIQAARQRSLTIEKDGKKIELTRTTLVPMLRVGGKTGGLVMTLDTTLINAYLDKQTDPFFIAAIPTKVSNKDGVETNRTEGTPGTKLDSKDTASQAAHAFEQSKTSVTPVFATINPEVKTTYTYTETDAALHKVIEDFTKSHSGKYYVAAVELKGPGHRSAFYNADTSLVAASTYKVFLAYGILQRIEAGTLTKSSPTSAGTVGYCMQRAMIVSDNTCASALQTVLGWAVFDTKLKADGFNATILNNYYTGDKLSTARDEMAVLTRIYNHELVNASSADYLFGLMKQQTYREGIVAGSRGAEVAAKVGFLDAYYHDVGIVYAPKATYALVIMTDGAGGFNNVRLLAEQIYDYYNK